MLPSAATSSAPHIERLLKLHNWWMRVDSDDPSVHRRARTFIPLITVMITTSTLSTIALIFIAPGPFIKLQYMMITSSVVSNLAAVYLARRGHMNWAGFASGGVTLLAFLAGNIMFPAMILALGWFFGVGILLASYAMEPRRLFWMWVFAQSCLTLSFRFTGAPQIGQPEMWEPTMGILLLFVTLASYLHSRATELVFTQQLEGARQLDQARHDAEQANRAKSAFLANMSHELRTPLNAILGYSEMLIEEHEDDAMTVSDLERIHSSGNHLLTLINDILDLSKIEAGKMDLLIESFSVEEVFEQINATMQSVVTRNQNRIICTIDRSCGRIASDRTKVRQVLLNLISNSAKFTQDGTITISARRTTVDRRRVLEVSVSDTGIGMNEDQLSRVFNEFEQADKSTTKEYGGTGLGLALCRRICQILEGDIHATSQPGVGSTFTFTISVEHTETSPEVAAALHSASIPLASGGEHGGSGLDESSQTHEEATLLVIDDDPDSHALISRSLKREGLHVLSARSGEHGFEVLRSGARVDLILLDILMPDESGWQVLHRLKSDPLTQDIPVILMSVIDEQQRGLALGASDYVVKPIERARLLSAIERLTPHHDPDTTVQALVVEDDPNTRELLSRMLAAQAWQVELAHNGLQALERLETFTPHIILLDLMMPKMDGFEVLRALRADPRWRHIPVIIVTAKSLTSEERDFLRQGATQILQKGELDHTQLVAQARQALRRHEPRDARA